MTSPAHPTSMSRCLPKNGVCCAPARLCSRGCCASPSSAALLPLPLTRARSTAQLLRRGAAQTGRGANSDVVVAAELLLRPVRLLLLLLLIMLLRGSVREGEQDIAGKGGGSVERC